MNCITLELVGVGLFKCPRLDLEELTAYNSYMKQMNEAPNLIEINVADRLASLREDQGLTLRQLAIQCNLSESYLSRVENHKSAISIANLARVAVGLNAPVSVFFKENVSARLISVCRSGRGKLVRLSSKGPQVLMLAADKGSKLMEPIIVDLATAPVDPVPRSHQGDEFIYVLEGKCTLVYGKDEMKLQKGDSVYYDPRIPHCTKPDPKEGCKVLSVVASRDYLFHGDLSRLLNEGHK